MKLIIGIGLIIIGLAFKFGAIAFFAHGICRIAKYLIQYNTEYKDQYARHQQAEQDINDIEAELNEMKDHDWSKEPPKQ